MKFQKVLFFTLLFSLIVFQFFFLTPVSIKASGNQPPADKSVGLDNPLGGTDIPPIISRIITHALGIVGALALLMFIWGGFIWMTAAGNTERVKKGMNTLLWATIGLVVIFASYVILKFIFDVLTKRA